MKLATKIKRLRELADLLDRVPERKFNMNTWANELPHDLDPMKEDECGTTACVLGWATTLPFARKLGARIEPMGWGVGIVRTHASDLPREAARELFGLTDFEQTALFYCGRSMSPTGKAAQIRSLCSKLEAR